MANRKETLTCSCDFSGVRPAVMDLPYPPIRVRERNPVYVDLIGVSYCGMISEMSAVMQYINNESRVAASGCAMGKTLLGMAIAEMTHMQMLGGLIGLLGGECLLHFETGGCAAVDVVPAVPDAAGAC